MYLEFSVKINNVARNPSGMQAAIDIQLEEIMKQHPKKKVAMISFSNDVVLIGDANASPQIIAGDFFM